MFDMFDPSTDGLCIQHGQHAPWDGQPLRPAPETPSLSTWRQHQGCGRDPVTLMPDDAPFDPAFLARITRALAPFQRQDVALLFVTAGHQPHYRSPVLPHLLSALPPFSNVIALRKTPHTWPTEATLMTDAIIAQGKACLVIRDQTQRLLPADAPLAASGSIHFALLTPAAAKGAAA